MVINVVVVDQKLCLVRDLRGSDPEFSASKSRRSTTGIPQRLFTYHVRPADSQFSLPKTLELTHTYIAI